MAVKEFLDSDRVNFLIWRYLLEGNYRETAAKFQKEWQVKQPHHQFSFAPHVKGHALVSVINRGLLYQSLERQRASSQLSDDLARTAEAESLQVGIFGPLSAQPPAKVEDDGVPATTIETVTTNLTPFAPPTAITTTDATSASTARVQDHAPANSTTPVPASAEETEFPRKRSHPHLQNGSPIKRPRLSHGYENGTTDAAPGTDPMDIDQDQHDNHAYPSPLEGEEATSPIPHTEGPEQGTQHDKVEELTPHTTFIRLTDDRWASGHFASPGADMGAQAANAPTLLHCQWNPKDPSVLAAAGSGALARIWSVSRAPTSDSDPHHDHVPSNGLSLLEPDAPLSTVVSQLAWTSDGNSVALVAESGGQTAILVCASDGGMLQTFDSAAEQVIKLLWNKSNTALLAISPSPDENGAIITVYQNFPNGTSQSLSVLSYTLPDHDINAAPLDASWSSDVEFIICGGNFLATLFCAEDKIVQVRKFETKPDDALRSVLYDWHSELTATGSETGILDLWDTNGRRRSIQAHQGAITSMEWQPLTGPANSDDERLIATGGEDCAILIWNARMPESKQRCFLTMTSPIVRLAFTPDGAFIAGASASQVLIWKVSSPTFPRASWRRKSHPGWESPRTASDSDEEYAEHCLCWDANGQKLAYGSNSRLAIINWRR